MCNPDSLSGKNVLRNLSGRSNAGPTIAKQGDCIDMIIINSRVQVAGLEHCACPLGSTRPSGGNMRVVSWAASYWELPHASKKEITISKRTLAFYFPCT